jgi:hypothetical protein
MTAPANAASFWSPIDKAWAVMLQSVDQRSDEYIVELGSYIRQRYGQFLTPQLRTLFTEILR